MIFAPLERRKASLEYGLPVQKADKAAGNDSSIRQRDAALAVLRLHPSRHERKYPRSQGHLQNRA